MVASQGIVGNYVIGRELGRGGMGIVYAATHRVLGKPAAIKVLLNATASNTDQVDRFFNEARAAMAIDHPGIVKILDVGWAADGRAFIAMELLAGESLAVQLERGPLPVRTAVERAKQIAEVLDAAHTAGIIHRDLKPDNVMIVGGTVKLLDFGIAKLHGSLAGAVKTVSGAMIGTPTYMAPEQCEGSAELDARADLYSLGCLLFAMLTGRPPFDEGGAGGIIGAHLHVPPPPLRSRCAAASPALEALVACLLAKRREERFQTARAVIGALSAPEVLTLDGPDATADLPAARSAVLAHVSSTPPPAQPPTPPPVDIRDRLTVDETESPYKHPRIHVTQVPAPAPVAAASSKRRLVVGGIGIVAAIAIVVAVVVSRGSARSTSSSGEITDAAAIATTDRVGAGVASSGDGTPPPAGTPPSETSSGSSSPPTGSNSNTRPDSRGSNGRPDGSGRGSNARSDAGSARGGTRPDPGSAAPTDPRYRAIIATQVQYNAKMCACRDYTCSTPLSEQRKVWIDTQDLSKMPTKDSLELGELNVKFAECLVRASAGKPTPAPVQSVTLFAGSYSTTEGNAVLRQTAANPTVVTGRYAKGTLECKAAGDELVCRWFEPMTATTADVEGSAKLKRLANGNLVGTYGFDGNTSGGGAWNFTLLKPGALE